MYWLSWLVMILTAGAFCYKIYCQFQIVMIEKKKFTLLFCMVIACTVFIPVVWRLKNTSAIIAATRANAALCIFYSGILVWLACFADW